ncbi:ABC transporter ATP-binding protein [Pseudanabaena sp. FACHB-2040]|uniref:ABC transporter ATP-binding protein n=1 Tax=Pseudanabaena sp. FACHB-2040 TaxID=2692859 RepID=UPI0016823502|nr:ABC transporter ATP-binding protein [Pseudanabaena sp. FACHB-2040]MBD2256341.1 ABC transporter ATP-binding protein [Pseudanabaena sp. FACHB-2040]
MNNEIVVHNLGKYFSQYHTHKPATIMEAALGGVRRMHPVRQFWALRHISFTVGPGEMLGVIGHNGAGKSTLLRLLGGVGRPDEGQIRMRGRIGALLELGAGFHGDLSGRENVFVMAVVAGLTRREVAKRFDSIVEFSELHEFIDNPVRTYSTGMQMRLAFSVAVHTDPGTLLVDEFLSVGDLAFQSKCLNQIAELKRQGCAIVLISHDTAQVEQMCDRVLWLRQGQAVAYGTVPVVVGQYVTEMRTETLQRTPQRPPQLTRSGQELKVNENRFGSQEVEILDVQLLPGDHIDGGDPLCVEITYNAPNKMESVIFSISINREDDVVCLDENTQNIGPRLPLEQGKGKIKFYCERLDLCSGKYSVNVGIFEQTWQYAYDYHWHAYPLWVRAQSISKAVLAPPIRWEVANLVSTTGRRLDEGGSFLE